MFEVTYSVEGIIRKIMINARATLEANITNIKNRIDAEIVELFRRKEK